MHRKAGLSEPFDIHAIQKRYHHSTIKYACALFYVAMGSYKDERSVSFQLLLNLNWLNAYNR